MIHYDQGRWGIKFVFQVTGSVIPQALVWAVPCAFLAGILQGTAYGAVKIAGVDTLWSGYTFILGFLLVFRNNQAYSRFWEGATLIQQVRGELFNAASSIIAFSSQGEEKREQVEAFQHLLVRLMSMLYCAALQQVAIVDDDNFDIIDNEGMETESLLFLARSNDRCEIILQWIQRLVVDAHEKGTINVPPPILSRSFQELSRGIVNLNNVRKIKEIPFPFPYAQVSTVMLLVHWIITPIFASQYIEKWWWASIVTLVVTAAFWSISYIAQEIEQPFGEDQNDLPIAEMQSDMNRSLRVLMEPQAQTPPKFDYRRERDRILAIRRSDLDELLAEAARAEMELPHQPLITSGPGPPPDMDSTSNGDNASFLIRDGSEHGTDPQEPAKKQIARRSTWSVGISNVSPVPVDTSTKQTEPAKPSKDKAANMTFKGRQQRRREYADVPGSPGQVRAPFVRRQFRAGSTGPKPPLQVPQSPSGAPPDLSGGFNDDNPSAVCVDVQPPQPVRVPPQNEGSLPRTDSVPSNASSLSCPVIAVNSAERDARKSFMESAEREAPSSSASLIKITSLPNAVADALKDKDRGPGHDGGGSSSSRSGSSPRDRLREPESSQTAPPVVFCVMDDSQPRVGHTSTDGSSSLLDVDRGQDRSRRRIRTSTDNAPPEDGTQGMISESALR